MTQKSSSVTIRDVAQRAGVSVATVSRYINRSARVSEKVSRRIQRAIIDLDYTPHATARQLATQKTRIIGLLLTNIHNVFFAPLFRGIEAVIQQEGYNLLVATYHAGRDTALTPPLGPHNTDGLIIFADSLSDDLIVQYHRRDFPMVLIHRSSPTDFEIPAVTIENKNATSRIVEHLIAVHGRKNILFVSGSATQEDSYWREMGYREALQKYQIAHNPDLVIEGGFERETTYQEMQRFLNSGHPAFDAVFACDDDSAIGVLEALSEAGYRVPEDVSVAGFNDLRLSTYFSPALTTVKAPTELVGRTAAQHLFALLSGGDVKPVTLLPTEIIIRHSCGC